MNFIIEHIGKIRKADLKLDGITVIAGPNGSGKSTISRVLMTLCSVLRRLPSRIIDERLKSVRESVNGILKSHDLPEVAHLLFDNNTDLVKFMRPESWNDYKIIEEHLLDDPEYVFFSDRNAKSDAEDILAIKDGIISTLKEVQERGIDYYLPSIFSDSFETALNMGLATTEGANCSTRLSVNGEAETILQFTDGNVRVSGIAPADKIPTVFYFEPIHLLDFYAAARGKQSNGTPRWRFTASNRYAAPDADWREFLFGDVDKTKWSVERKNKHEEILKTLDELLNVMRGHLEKQERELRFVDDEASISVPVMNVASGIKTMSAIEKGIRAGAIQSGCLLIIDEPESNLHPQWQIEFAHFLVKLNAQFSMKLLLNTHSPFFLKAIEVFSREENCDMRTHYYRMEKDDTDIGYATRELMDGTNEIFKTYFDAMNELLSR